MPAKMTPEQLDFWRELLAPFRPDELSVKRLGGKDLTYIDKRSLANRLDTVVGPDGWFPEYRDEGGRGLVCRLHLRVPTGSGTYVFMHKEEGGADEGMTKKVGGDNQEDVDNNFESEFTNSFRRAAQDAWGIGRYLYEKGIPGFLDPNARPGQVSPQAAPAPVQQHTPAQQAQSTPVADRFLGGRFGIDNYRIPSPKAMFPWVKEMETVFKTYLLKGINGDSEALGFPKVFAQCSDDQIKTLALKAIDYIKTLPTYEGQFDHISTSHPVDPSDQAAGPLPACVDIGELRKSLMALMQEHVVKSIGREATPTELKASFIGLATHCKDGSGQMGQTPASLSGLADTVWLENMIAFVKDQIRNCAPQQTGAAPTESIPF